MYSHKRSRDPHVLQESYSEGDMIYTEQREIRDFPELQADHAAKENRQLCQNSLKRNTIRDCFLKNSRIESEDRPLRASNPRIHSQRTELYQANQSSDHSRREKDWLCIELEERERALQKLKKFCCTEAERAQQLRTDELS